MFTETLSILLFGKQLVYENCYTVSFDQFFPPSGWDANNSSEDIQRTKTDQQKNPLPTRTTL
jgi:hypothetical protein